MMIELEKRLENLIDKKIKLIVYIEMKLKDSDWHGVADAAMDLREIEAKIQLLRELVDG